MNVVALSYVDLAAAAGLILLLGALSVWLQLALERQLLIAAARTVAQLLLVGIILRAVFAAAHPLWIVLIGAVMLAVATREVAARQTQRLRGIWYLAPGFGGLLLSCASVLLLTLIVFVGNQPWYEPRYAIPIFGMLLGNCMTGIALALSTLLQSTVAQRAVIEQRLALGQTREAAISDIQRNSARTAMIPTINAMATAGLVSLPGMMTGQILAGTEPMEAVKYQILIMFLITASTGFGILIALRLTTHKLFDERHRLRLDRLRKKES